VIGYSQGSAQNLYGLAKKQDWFAKRVNRFIAIAPCIAAVIGRETHATAAKIFSDLRNEGKFISRLLKSDEPLIDCSNEKYKGKDCTY